MVRQIKEIFQSPLKLARLELCANSVTRLSIGEEYDIKNLKGTPTRRLLYARSPIENSPTAPAQHEFRQSF